MPNEGTPQGNPGNTGTPPETVTLPHVKNDVEANKDLAAFSYIYVMSVIIYVLKGRDSAFIRFHSKQAMVLFLLAIVVAFIPFIHALLEIVVLAGVVVGFVHAAQGQWKDVWVVGPLSRGEMSVREAWKEVVATVSRLVRSTKQSGKDGHPPAGPAPHPDTSHPSAAGQNHGVIDEENKLP